MKSGRARLGFRARTGVLLAASILAVGILELDEALPAGTGTAGASPASRPNIVVIETDGQTVESLRHLVRIETQLMAAGTTFTNSFASTPLETPSRATFLTGQYSHNHHVRSDPPPDTGPSELDQTNTLPVWLEQAGYHTVMVGRYLNGYGTTNPLFVPRGWSEWYASVDPSTYDYYGYTLNENGAQVTYGYTPAEYQTDIYAAKAAEIITRLAPSEQPFFLWASFLAPRAEGVNDPADGMGAQARPAPRDYGQFGGEALPSPPSFNEANVSDKPRGIRALPRLSGSEIQTVRQHYDRRLEALLAVDQAVGTVISRLRDSGELADTLIMFTSDTGFMQGEHRIANGNGVPYDASIRVPLILRGPHIPHDQVMDDLVSNADLAPTILDAADTKSGRTLDGASLLPLATDPVAELGRDVLLEAPGYVGLRTPRYKYVEYTDGERELYDEVVDPYELTNRAHDSAYAQVRADLVRRLAALRACSGSACRAGPRLALELTKGRWRTPVRGGCAPATFEAAPVGVDLRFVGRVSYYAGSLRIAVSGKPPFRVTITRAELGPPGGVKFRARMDLSDSRRVTKSRTLAVC